MGEEEGSNKDGEASQGGLDEMDELGAVPCGRSLRRLRRLLARSRGQRWVASERPGEGHEP